MPRRKKKSNVQTMIKYRGQEAPLDSKEGETLMTEMVQHALGAAGEAGILTPANLLTVTQKLRNLVIVNAHRIPKFKAIADRLGSIETLLIEGSVEVEDKKQEKLPLDKPEKVDRELKE